MKLSKLLENFGALSKEQYLRCRDAGFSAHDLIDKNQLWYDQNISIINWNNSQKQPAYDKQIETLLKYGIEIDMENITYSIGRAAMRELAIRDGTDIIYLEQIALFKKQNDHRNAMKRQKRSEASAASKSEGSINKKKILPAPLADLEIIDD